MFSDNTYAIMFSLKYTPIILLHFFKVSILFNWLTFALGINNYVPYYIFQLFLKFIETSYKNLPVSTGSTITIVK